jgi:hypothetical protein
VLQEPVGSVLRHPPQRARLLEQVRRAGNGHEALDRRYVAHRTAIQRKHFGILAADDEESGCAHRGQRVPSKVRTSTAADDRTHAVRMLCGCDQGSRCARTRAEKPEGKAVELLAVGKPPQRATDALREERNIEPQFAGDSIDFLLCGHEQIHEQRRQSP